MRQLVVQLCEAMEDKDVRFRPYLFDCIDDIVLKAKNLEVVGYDPDSNQRYEVTANFGDNLYIGRSQAVATSFLWKATKLFCGTGGIIDCWYIHCTTKGNDCGSASARLYVWVCPSMNPLSKRPEEQESTRRLLCG